MLFFLRFGRETVVFSVGEILPLRCFFVVARDKSVLKIGFIVRMALF